jgi:hypothetical protein
MMQSTVPYRLPRPSSEQQETGYTTAVLPSVSGDVYPSQDIPIRPIDPGLDGSGGVAGVWGLEVVSDVVCEPLSATEG